MTDQAPIETTNLGSDEDTAIAWSRPRDLLTAPSPPDHPGGYFPTYLSAVRPDGRPHTAAVGALIRQSGCPVECTAGGFTAPFGPQDGGPPPWQLYRFVFHTAIGHGSEGATRWRFAR
ncbi:MAG TPA: hypothetical protein VMM78_01985 [Thermomicrobiales bacterium]|nr:hypothetical protein [Thermomicrobiales bacterium]